MSTPTEPDVDTDTDALISNAGDIGCTITIVTMHDGDTILIPWHMLDEVSIQDQRIKSLNHRHITRPHPMPHASIALDTQN
jgi:hypothetical protein